MTDWRTLLQWEYGFRRRHVPFVLGYAGLTVALYLAVPVAARGGPAEPTVGALAVGSYLLVANAAFSWTGDELTTATAWSVVVVAGFLLVVPVYWALSGPAEFGSLRSLPGGRASIAVVAATCVTAVVIFPVASFKQFGRTPERGRSVEEDVLSGEEYEEFERDDEADWRGPWSP